MKRLLLVALLLLPSAVYSQELDADVAVEVFLGPFLDGTDGITPETALTVTEFDMDIMYSDGTQDDITVTASGGANDCVHEANGYYKCELTAADVDTAGNMIISVNHATPATFVPVYHEYVVRESASYDAVVSGNTMTAAVVNAQADLALSDIGLDNVFSLVDGVADSGTTTTLVDSALTQATDDWFKGQTLVFTDGTLALQTSCIIGFTASSDTITFFPAVTTAVVTHQYQILAQRCNADLYTVQADTAFPWHFGPFRSTTNGITKATASDGAPTCTRSIDGAAWAAADNAEGTIDAEGWSSLTLSATETGATDNVRFSCALTGFIDVDAIFHIQR